ncbi:hypothetical protein EG346_02030 [Chryseobacterium carnipullorum]|uniref:Uncharacterized protein n=1 Tax=Chryseobacterium carnipullorum TaxID=1124835 RepID=A0A376EEK3_CHRCU|nr:hypothetical protein [Chryseobacterium carnipullorum]AZA47049.1 hypothetical protein EG346_02030 [Chryseobacterium carnipullorum]STD07563.1 Uncharacterised protein [Chryseobacterium carnipullorum]
MNTTIKRKITITEIEKLFEKRELINIRYYHCIDKKFSENELEVPFLFEITIRHNEDENVMKIWTTAHKEIKNQKSQNY